MFIVLPQEANFHADIETLRVLEELHRHRRRRQRSPNLDDACFLRSRQNGNLLDQPGRRGDVKDRYAPVQLGRRHVHRDVSESLEGRGVQRTQHRALDRLVHQLVPLIVHDLMRRGAGRGAAALSIMMRDRSPFPGGARVFLILERPVKTSGDRRHVVRADCGACDAVTVMGEKKNSIKASRFTGEEIAASISENHSIINKHKERNDKLQLFKKLWTLIGVNFYMRILKI